MIRWLVRRSETLAQALALVAALGLALVAAHSCGEPEPYDECNPAPDPYHLSQHYSPRPDVATPLGVRVDRNGQSVDLWRVLTQGSTIIAPPDLRMLPGAVVSLATGVADPWTSELARCAAPLPPLGWGS